MTPPAVQRFLDVVLAQEGAPYVWAGKGEYVAGKRHAFTNTHGAQRLVFDCSGLITWALRRCGWTPRVEFNADRMWKTWVRVEKPQPGDIICYGTLQRCSHVEVVLEGGDTFGAIGGNSKTLRPTEGAAVQHRLRPRKDILGFVVNPLRDSREPPA